MRQTQFEIDSGCGVTVMNRSVFKTLRGKEAPKLHQCRVRLRTYTGRRVNVLGAAVVKVQHKGVVQDLPVVVVAGLGPSLVGRYWIRRLGLQWRSVPQNHHVQEETSEEVHGRPDPQIHHVKEETLEGENGEVFKDELGRFKGPPVKIYVDKEAAPRFFKARPIPYVMRGRIEAELKCLLAQDLSRKVKEKQERQIKDQNKKAKGRWFKTGDSVLTQNFSLGPKWILGIVESVTGPVSYKVMLGGGRVVRRHVDQIHTHHQRPEKCNGNQQAACIQLSQADEKK